MMHLAEAPASTQRFRVVFRAPGTLWAKMPPVRRGHRCPFSIGCGFAAWSGVTAVRKLGRFNGIRQPVVSQEAGVWTRIPWLVKSELAILKPQAERGFVIWIKCLREVSGGWIGEQLL